MGINLERQFWVNLGRTEKATELEYMTSVSSPACHSLAKRMSSMKRWPEFSNQHPWHYL